MRFKASSDGARAAGDALTFGEGHERIYGDALQNLAETAGPADFRALDLRRGSEAEIDAPITAGEIAAAAPNRRRLRDSACRQRNSRAVPVSIAPRSDCPEA